MGPSEEVRRHVLENYVEPARAVGLTRVTIRAGNVHAALGYSDRMPAVCDALDTQIFLELAGVTLVERLGPRQGPNAHWVFDLG